MSTLEHAYRYAGRSGLGDQQLALVTSEPDAVARPFLRARALRPDRLARGLREVSEVVRARHHVPPAMLERILLEADPVLTWGASTLRVEGFSSCCGVYARLDVAEDAFDVAVARPGTTNVDFDAPMRAGLAQVRSTDRLVLTIGTEGLAVEHVGPPGVPQRLFERRVRLPHRWLRGFVEVALVQRRMERRLELSRASATRLLRGLPKGARPSEACWVVPVGRDVRLGAQARPGGVRLAGCARLRTLEPLLPWARRLDVFEDPQTGASAWRLGMEDMAFTLVLSPETWRGFSGEGQALAALTGAPRSLAAVRGQLDWNAVRTTEAIATTVGLACDEVEQTLAWLAAQGQVAYDLEAEAWFHRRLPFEDAGLREAVGAHHPRLRSARALFEARAVEIVASGPEGYEAKVASGEVVHRVVVDAEGERCTCPWYATHGDARGPCKHMLAARMTHG